VQALLDRVKRLIGREPTACCPVTGGFTPAQRFRVEFADGSSAFAKLATTEPTAAALRAEHRWYSALRAAFMPALLGFEDGPCPLLVLEDLSHAHWPPPWHGAQPARVLAALRELAATRPLPADLPVLEGRRSALAGWVVVERDPEPLLALELCSQRWLARALPELLRAEQQAQLSGDDLLHLDVRSDNLCLAGERVVFVDWNCAARGNAAVDRAFLAPSLRLEGGPLPEEIMPGHTALAAFVAGFFAARAGLAPIPDAPGVRPIQLRQLRIALPWAARALGLPPPDGCWAQLALSRATRALAAGEIAVAGWHLQMEELIGDAYLAAADPRAQSGKSGDETDWRWSRELILEALPRGGSVLDVGCANGYLMESLARWAGERGQSLVVHGLEISPRLATLARTRLPDMAERVHTGNAIDWCPPQRFDLVHTGLDYVPAFQQRELLVRLCRDVVAPGGRIVLRAERVRSGSDDVRAEVEALGFSIGGVIERRHPHTGELRRSVWLDANQVQADSSAAVRS
jgi:SAM-dependent methyltransferase